MPKFYNFRVGLIYIKDLVREEEKNMSERVIPGSGYDSGTRNRILDASAELFALRGFGAVSMRDIAKAVGIKMSSIYHYYEGKEALMEDVISHFERGYRDYFEWLTSMNEKAESLEELMDNMFNKEFLEMHNPIGCMGFSLALREQHNSESVQQRVFELFYKHSISCLQAGFDRLIEKGVIPPSDTGIIATLFIFCVMAGNDIHLHEYTGAKPPIDCNKMYSDLKKFITGALIQGSGKDEKLH